MPMSGLEPFEIEIVNTKQIVRTEDDYALMALDCLDEAGL
jgi:hypothetical protein